MPFLTHSLWHLLMALMIFFSISFCFIILVCLTGFEPVRYFYHSLLRTARLPVPAQTLGAGGDIRTRMAVNHLLLKQVYRPFHHSGQSWYAGWGSNPQNSLGLNEVTLPKLSTGACCLQPANRRSPACYISRLSNRLCLKLRITSPQIETVE